MESDRKVRADLENLCTSVEMPVSVDAPSCEEQEHIAIAGENQHWTMNWAFERGIGDRAK
jgi:hypothetical protein